jgi:hypothetical protein
MPQKPLQGFDVSVMVVGPEGPAFVGEFQEVSVNIANDIEEYLALGSRMPQLLDGEIKVDGSLKRGFIDVGKSLLTAFGAATMQPGVQFSSPRYVITADFNAPAKGLVGRYQMTGCIVDKLSLTAQKGKAVVNSDYTFRAEGIQEA